MSGRITIKRIRKRGKREWIRKGSLVKITEKKRSRGKWVENKGRQVGIMRIMTSNRLKETKRSM